MTENVAITQIAASSDDKFIRFERGMRSYASKPPANDPYLASYAIGLSQGYYDPTTGIKPMLQQAIAATDFPSSYSLRKPADYYQYQHRNDPQYPSNHVDPNSWKTGFTEIARDPARREDFIHDFVHHVLDATVVKRFKAVPLATAMFRDRFGDSPSFVNYGSGIGLGDKKLAARLGSERFKEIILHSSDEASRDELEARVHIATAHTPSQNYSSITAVDMKPPPTPASVERTMVSSMNPGEWADPINTEQFMTLWEADPQGVRNIWNTDMTLTPELPDVPPDGFNIGFSTTWWYMYRGKPVLDRILQNELANLSDDGVLLLQEHARPDKRSHGGVYLLDNWYQRNIKNPFRMMVFDKLTPELGFQTLFGFPSGRPDKSIALSRIATKMLRALQ